VPREERKGSGRHKSGFIAKPDSLTPYQDALAEHDVSKVTASVWQRFAAASRQEFEQALTGEEGDPGTAEQVKSGSP